MAKESGKTHFKTEMVPMLDEAEIRMLVQESNRPVEENNPAAFNWDYPTYSFEEVAALLANNYHPSMFRRRKHGLS